MNRLLAAARDLQRIILVWRIRLVAALRHAHVDVRIARGVQIEGGVYLRIYPNSSSVIRIGPGCRLGHGLRLVLDGGTLTVGERVNIRSGAVLHVSGELTLEDQTLLSYFSVIHCDEKVVLGTRSAFGEHLTVIDSVHVTPPEGEWWVDHIETAPVVIGSDIWGGSKVTIGSGVTIGDRCVVGAGAVVTTDVPSHSFVGGIPGRVIGPAALWPGSE